MMIKYVSKKHFAVPCEKYSLLIGKDRDFDTIWSYIEYVRKALEEQGLFFLVKGFCKDLTIEAKRCSPVDIDRILRYCKNYLDYANKMANERFS